YRTPPSPLPPENPAAPAPPKARLPDRVLPRIVTVLVSVPAVVLAMAPPPPELPGAPAPEGPAGPRVAPRRPCRGVAGGGGWEGGRGVGVEAGAPGARAAVPPRSPGRADCLVAGQRAGGDAEGRRGAGGGVGAAVPDGPAAGARRETAAAANGHVGGERAV